MATVRRSLSLVVALAISCAVYGDDHYEVNFGTQIGTATPRPRPAGPAGPAPTDDDGLPDTINWEATTGKGGGDIIIFEHINSEDDEDGPDFTAASETEPRRDKDLSRAAPAPRPAPRPCTTTKEPVLKPNPYEEASEPGDTIAATTGGGGTAEDSRKDRTLVHTVDVPIARPQDTSAGDSKEPDVDILIDSDGS